VNYEPGNHETGLECPSSSIFTYKKILFKLDSDLKLFKEFTGKLNLESASQSINEILSRIENDSFSIAVIGEFKRGKSTFINALLGREICPSDILPSTATINRVTYGLKPAVLIKYKDGREQEIPPFQLADYITKTTPESGTVAATIKEAVIYYPNQFCRNNVDLIDTPGLNDEERMDTLTFSILPQVDVAILIMMAESPFSEFERGYVEKFLSSDIGRVIFVVNAIDRLNLPGDSDRIIEAVKDRINNYLLKHAADTFGKESLQYRSYISKIGKLKVFGLSAYQALMARKQNDPELLAKSCFAQFEAALEEFLVRERGIVFLQTPIHHIISISPQILKAISNYTSRIEEQRRKLESAFSSQTISMFQSSKNKTLLQLDLNIENAAAKINNNSQLETALLKVAEQNIELAVIKSSELYSPATLISELSQSVTKSMQTYGAEFLAKAHSQMAGLLENELENLDKIIEKIDRDIQRMDGELTALINLLSYEKESLIPETGRLTLLQEVEAVRSVREMIGRYRNSCLKKQLNSLQELGVSLESRIFQLSDPIFAITEGGEPVRYFKNVFKSKVVAILKEYFNSHQVNGKFCDRLFDQINQFLSFKNRINKDLDLILDQLSPKVVCIRSRYEVLFGNELQKLEKMKRQTEKVQADACSLSEQLAGIITS
jgi:hypothetical protein